MDLKDIIINKQIMEEAVALAKEHKEYLHIIPEIGFKEHKTTEHIKEFCNRYSDLKYVDIGMDTGLVAYLDAGADDTVALRADIDALPTEGGPEHLCGHDSHAAGLMGALHYLSCAENLPHNVLFIFQPAEESTKGAKTMLDAGLLKNLPSMPIRLFGIHNRPEKDAGYVIVHKGPLMSAKSIFTITFKGRTGHGSTPHKLIDPIVAASAFILSVQSIISKNVDPFASSMCTVSSINAGFPDGTMPETALITGFFRSYDSDAHRRIEERIVRLAESTADAFECSCDMDINHAVPALVNSDDMYEFAYKAASLAVGEDNIIDSEPCLASEDFAVLGEYIPSFFYWVGSGTPGQINASWHDRAFKVDEHYLETAVPLLVASSLV